MPRKQLFKFETVITENKSIQTFSGDISIKVDGEWAGEAQFIIHKDNLYLADLNIVDGFQYYGLGRMAVDMLKSIAECEKKPITVSSLEGSFKFYIKCGFAPSTAKNKDKRIKIEYTFLKPDKYDLFWIPKSLKKRKRIKIRF